ncbi:MAG TPA: NUDIX domain-containing protein, partial [Elusimicrobiota bacterium]|nr:NUDIX domain-containing protein [Elusimicrobiota bacterium]
VPRKAEDLRSLPGIGRYTAGAVLSFSFNRPEPVVDGNVVRVLSRVYGIEEDVKKAATQEHLWGLAWKLVPRSGARLSGPHAFNSAIMDLGATVCQSASPECLLCPLRKTCWAYRHGAVERLPMAGEPQGRRVVHLNVGAVRSARRWLMLQRPAEGLYGGLWEFPCVETRTAVRSAEELLEKKLGVALVPVGALPLFRHVLSHRDLQVRSFVFDAGGDVPKVAGGKWFDLEEIARSAISTLTRKILFSLRRVQPSLKEVSLI